MLRKIKERRMKKKYEYLVSRLSDERNAFEDAVNASEKLSEHDKVELVSFYWDSIYSEIRFQRLKNLYHGMNFDIGIVYGSLISLGFLLFGYVTGVI